MDSEKIPSSCQPLPADFDATAVREMLLHMDTDMADADADYEYSLDSSRHFSAEVYRYKVSHTLGIWKP